MKGKKRASDAALLDALEKQVREHGPLVIHNGEGVKPSRGLGLANTHRTLRQALADMAGLEAAPQSPASDAEAKRLRDLINTPELDQWLRAVHIEAVHQVERWGTASDRAKRPADWFWLIGYLAGKALHAAIAGNTEKAKHHTISAAAALYNWHCAITGRDVRMCPGRSDLAEIVDREFPGEAQP